MSKSLPVRGTRDLFGDLAERFEAIRETSFAIAGLYGFSPIETPMFERVSVFKRAVGETTDIVGKEMYAFTDKGGEELALRPEGTAAIARAVVSNALTRNSPLKFSYFGPMFRYERPQKGRYRQFTQFGVELLGIHDPYADAEVMALGARLLKALKIESTLRLNTLGNSESRNAYRAALVDYFSRHANELSAESKLRLRDNPLRILDSKDADDQKLSADAPKIEAFLTAPAADFFDKVRDGLNALGVDYVEDGRLVRGLDYYAHTAFEFKSELLGAQDALGGGGRYDGLIERVGGGADVPGVGFGMGVDRLALIARVEAARTPPLAIVCIGDYRRVALKLAADLRDANKKVEIIHKDNVGKAFKEADRLGARHVIAIGENEIKTNSVKLKDLKAPPDHPEKERTVSVENLLKTIDEATRDE